MEKKPVRRPVIIKGPRPKVAGAKPVNAVPKTAAPSADQPAPKPIEQEPKKESVQSAAAPVSQNISNTSPTEKAVASNGTPSVVSGAASESVTAAEPIPVPSSTSVLNQEVKKQEPVSSSSASKVKDTADKKENTSKKQPVKQKPEKKPKTEKSGDPFKVVLIILVLLLTGATGYLLYDKISKDGLLAQQAEEAQKNNEVYKTDIANKIAEITRLQDSLRVVIAEKEALGLELTAERAKLAELESVKRELQAKQKSINALNQKLASINEKHESQQASLGALVAENQRLVSERIQLEQIVKAKDDSLKSYAEVHAKMAEKVEAASTLMAQNIEVTVFNAGGKEMNGTPKAMMVGKIKASMNLAENDIAEHGKKDIYLRIIEPSGTPLFEGDKSFVVNGKKTFYTEKQTIEFNNTKQKITFIYNKGSRYTPGKYTVEFWADGKKIGDSQFTLNR